MKTLKITLRIEILLGVLLLLSCNSRPLAVDQETLTVSAASPNSVIERPSPSVSMNVKPTALVTRTPKITSTTSILKSTAITEVTIVSTTSVLLSPMVDQEKRMTNLVELLNTNGGCDLPCWWGISPGQTLWSNAKQFLLSIGANIYSNYEFSKLVHSTPNFDEPVIKVSDNQPGYNDNRIYFIEKDKIVEQVYINADGWTNPKIFQSHWQSYMPRQILGKYGLPERIRVYTNSTSMGDRHSYDLWFIYDTKKFAIRYDGILQINNGNNFEICITKNGQEITQIELFTQAAHLVEPLEEMGGFTTAEYKNTLSIEDAAGIEVDKIYNLLSSDIQNACFTTPIDLWKK